MKPAYTFGTNITSIIDRLNPIITHSSHETPDSQFQKAVELIGEDFTRYIYALVHRWLPSRCVVRDALAKAREYDPEGRILVLDNPVPWKSHLLDQEKEFGFTVLYALFPDHHSKSWMIQAVPLSEDSEFEERLLLPVEWRGVRNAQLDEASGISGCIFVHQSGFIGGHSTFEGVLEMAKKAIQQPSSRKHSLSPSSEE